LIITNPSDCLLTANNSILSSLFEKHAPVISDTSNGKVQV